MSLVPHLKQRWQCLSIIQPIKIPNCIIWLMLVKKVDINVEVLAGLKSESSRFIRRENYLEFY